MDKMRLGAMLLAWATVFTAPAVAAGPFTLDARQMDRVTAAGIVTEIAATGFAAGDPSVTATDTDASVAAKGSVEFGSTTGTAESSGGDLAETVIFSSSDVDNGTSDSGIFTFTSGFAEGDASSSSQTRSRVISTRSVTIVIGSSVSRASGDVSSDAFSVVDPSGDLVRSTTINASNGSWTMSRSRGIGLTFN